MKIFKKLLTLSIITIIVSVIIDINIYKIKGASICTDYCVRVPVKIALFAKDLNDDYLLSLQHNFEDIQKKNEEKVIFSFYDAKFNKAKQNADIHTTLNEGIDLVLLDIVDINDLEEVIKEISKYNIPVIVFNREPSNIGVIKSYKKALLMGTDSKQAGTLQGEMIVDAWNKHKEIIDKNKDSVLQYIMLVGEKTNETSIDRSTYSVLTIQQANIKTQELASPVLNWNTETAQNTVEALFLRYSGKLEAIISNDDAMAIGAVQALQKYGYNGEDKSKTIPVVGIDGVPEAKDLIAKGFMLGTAVQDPNLANAIYSVGMNLINERNPVEDTPYKLDETGVTIRIPFQEYMGPMFE